MKQDYDFIQCIEFSDVRGVSLAAPRAAADLLPVPPPGLELCSVSDTVRSLHDGGSGPSDHYGGAGEGARVEECYFNVV